MREAGTPGAMMQIPSHSPPFEIREDLTKRRQPDQFNTLPGLQAAGLNKNLTEVKRNIDSSLAAIALHGDISGKLHEELSVQQAQYKQLHKELRDLRNRVEATAQQRGQLNMGAP